MGVTCLTLAIFVHVCHTLRALLITQENGLNILTGRVYAT
jgi:succinate dehydrogenase/fumarate reductase cytochrome b subunit